MSSPTTELIKNKLDIVEFLRGYVTLTPAGRNFKGLCPFHHEKSPSFMVSPERQSWHCFGCGVGGDAFAFVMRYENLDFSEALRVLAEKTGVELRHENPAEYKYSGLLYDLNDAAKTFFQKKFAASPIAQKYLVERGLTKETIDTFELGWAPNEPEALAMHLLNSGTSPQDLLQAGLAVKTERGMMLDRFRARVMFPIHNHVGRVVGFTGRILPQLDPSTRADARSGDTSASASGFVPAKYVNSPETPIFQKSKLIYGFWKSKDAVRAEKRAVLVEGQMDFLMSWQSGVRNVIASSGTALTADHLRALHRLAEELVINFDSDAAGSDAAERAIDLAEANT
jgi:DNA primase